MSRAWKGSDGDAVFTARVGEALMAGPDAATSADGAGTTRILVSLALASALAPLNSTMLSVALPAVSAEVSAGAATLTLWLVTSYVLVGIVSQSPGGKLGDLFGHRNALRAGQSIVAVGAVLGFVAPGLPLLVLARILMAIGGALITPAAMALVRSSLPAEQQPRAFGVLGAASGLAAALGPFVGGELVGLFGWRTLFLVNAVPLGLSAVLAERARRWSAPVPRPKLDGIGSLLLASGLTMLVGATRAPRPFGAILVVLSAVVLLAFSRWERRVAEPVVDLGLFRSRPFLGGSLVIALQNLAVYGLLFDLPFLLSGPLHATAADTGRTLLPLMATVVVFAASSGLVSARVGARTTVAAGAILAVVGMSGVAFLHHERPRDLLASLVVLGAGVGLSTSPCQAAAMSVIDAPRSGMAAALLSTSRYLGGVVGIALLGLVMPDAGMPALAQHRSAIALFAVALGLSAAFSMWLPNTKLRRAPKG